MTYPSAPRNYSGQEGHCKACGQKLPEPPKPPELSPAQDLFMEVMIARARLGERMWTFSNKHKATANALSEKSLLVVHSGNVEKTFRASLTVDAEKMYLAFPYVPPILRGRN